jgi:DNA polymerase V
MTLNTDYIYKLKDRVKANSMLNAEIHPGDILIVDKSLDPLPNNIMVATVGGELHYVR